MNAPMPASLRRATVRPPEWSIPCPVAYCRALAGQRCTSPRGRAISGGSHGSRLDAYLIQQHGEAS